jgi:hypothetical protein
MNVYNGNLFVAEQGKMECWNAGMLEYWDKGGN